MIFLDPGPDVLLARALVSSLGVDGAHRCVDSLVKQFSNVELAALATHWPMWARPKQLAPAGDWLSWGFLTSRGWGKTLTIGHWITGEVMAGRAPVVIMAAQNLTKTEDVQIGGLIDAAPPWFKPEYRATPCELHWPNGSIGYAFTPEVPGAIRSQNAAIAWMSEMQSWPEATREEAYSNFDLATRVGYARTVWDSTPKRGHPILKRLLAAAVRDPSNHHVVRGTVHENHHLPERVIAKWFAEYGDTAKGREELLGEMIDDVDGALVKQEWINLARRPRPDTFLRKILAVDPAVTTNRGSDKTGIVLLGLGVDGQVYVLADYSGKMPPREWCDLLLKVYRDERCSLLVAETNRGYNLIAEVLRASADRSHMNVVILGKDEKPEYREGIVYVREVHAQGAKEDRAQPLATAYERGRISHVAVFDDLEETLTTWVPRPGAKSPDAMDAATHGVVELLGLSLNNHDPAAGFVGIREMGRALAQPPAATLSSNVAKSFAAALRGSGGGGRI